MPGKLEKCPRCSKLFTSGQYAVCGACQPEEEREYDLILRTLDEHPGLGAAQLAELCGLDIGVVLRMQERGGVESAENEQAEAVKCGRCGAPAISKNKRLCQGCLSRLDLETAEAMRGMREGMKAKPKKAANSVHDTLTKKRDGERPAASQTDAGRGMASRDHIDRRRK